MNGLVLPKEKPMNETIIDYKEKLMNLMERDFHNFSKAFFAKWTFKMTDKTPQVSTNPAINAQPFENNITSPSNNNNNKHDKNIPSLSKENQSLNNQSINPNDILQIKQNTESILQLLKNETPDIKNNNKNKNKNNDKNNDKNKNKNNNNNNKSKNVSPPQKKPKIPKPSVINTLQPILTIKDICSGNVYSPIELKDKKIAIGTGDGTLSVFSINYDTKKWRTIVNKKQAHGTTRSIQSICGLPDGRFVSASKDSTIKLWQLIDNDLTCLKTFTAHKGPVYKVIPLTKNRFASCSGDKTVKIWNINEPFQEIATLPHEHAVLSIVQLTNKEELVSSSNATLKVWDLNAFKVKNVIKGYHASYANHMIEIPNGNIAICAYNIPESIFIIDIKECKVIQEIKSKGFINGNSSLVVWDKKSFIYVCQKCLVQIDIQHYQIICEIQNQNDLGGNGGIALANDGRFLVSSDNKNGLEIFEPKYVK